MTYNDMAKRIDFADQTGATHATIEINEGEFKMTLREAHETWENLAPGEPFSILALHWEEPEQLLHFSGSDPSPEERATLNQDYAAYLKAREGESGDDEHAAAANFIESLMRYAEISEA